MQRFKRPMNLTAVKNSFHQSGYVDWHLNPRMSDLPHEDHEGEVVVQTARPELKRPPLYAVVLMNDDYTPMDFVIEVLEHYFSMDFEQASQVMLTVHYEGKGTAGIYPRDIAETKANQVNNYARSQSHTLLCLIEPEHE